MSLVPIASIFQITRWKWLEDWFHQDWRVLWYETYLRVLDPVVFLVNEEAFSGNCLFSPNVEWEIKTWGTSVVHLSFPPYTQPKSRWCIFHSLRTRSHNNIDAPSISAVHAATITLIHLPLSPYTQPQAHWFTFRSHCTRSYNHAAITWERRVFGLLLLITL